MFWQHFSRFKSLLRFFRVQTKNIIEKNCNTSVVWVKKKRPILFYLFTYFSNNSIRNFFFFFKFSFFYISKISFERKRSMANVNLNPLLKRIISGCAQSKLLRCENYLIRCRFSFIFFLCACCVVKKKKKKKKKIIIIIRNINLFLGQILFNVSSQQHR